MAVFTGTNAADNFIGIDGVFDRVIYNSALGTTVDLMTPANNTGKAIGDTFTSIEGFNLAGGGNDTFVGTGSAEVVTGGGGNDIIDGGGGADRLGGGSGDDVFRFGAGYDASNAVFNGNDGFDTLLIVYDVTPVVLEDSVLQSIEQIAFSSDNSTLVIGEPDFIPLIDGSATENDTVVISNFDDGQDPRSAYFDLIDSQVETVKVFRDNMFEITVTSGGPDLIDVRTDDISAGGTGSGIQYSIQSFDRDYDLRALEQLNDDGRLVTGTYDEDGVILSRTTSDTLDTFSYETTTTTYTGGIRDLTVTDNDNGTLVTTVYDSLGDRQTVTRDDIDDAFNYTQIVDSYFSAAEGGLRAERFTTYDEGDSRFAETTFSYNEDGSLSFREIVFQNGRITQIGYDNNDLLSGGSESDNLIGGGGNDTFVFVGSSIGTDVVGDFDDFGDDIIDLTAYGLLSRDDIEISESATIEQVGSGVRINLDDVGTIVLANTDLNTIGNDDFAGFLMPS